MNSKLWRGVCVVRETECPQVSAARLPTTAPQGRRSLQTTKARSHLSHICKQTRNSNISARGSSTMCSVKNKTKNKKFILSNKKTSVCTAKCRQTRRASDLCKTVIFCLIKVFPMSPVVLVVDIINS